MAGLGIGNESMGGADVPESRDVTRLLRLVFALALLVVVGGTLKSSLFDPATARAALPYNLLISVACLAAAAMTYRPQFSLRWREITLIASVFSVWVIAAEGAKFGEQLPTFVVILVLLTATGMVLPWEARWQGALTASLVAAGVAVSTLVHPSSSHIALLWLGTLATAALALAGNGLRTEQEPDAAEREHEREVHLQKLFGADVGQVSLMQLRGRRFINVNEELVANLSYDLRSSLNSIMGMADLLADTQLTPEQRRYVDTVAINGSSLLDFINVILDLTKIESGRLRLEESEFDLEEIIEVVAERVRARAHEKGIELIVRVHPDVPATLCGDPSRLRQVLLNLLDNAVKFTEHGEVTLAVEYDQAAIKTAVLRFTVQDTGIGIAADELGAVFQAFARGGSSIGREYSGSGIGLAMAQRLVELMGGRIRVESARGKGSTFYFTAQFGLRNAAETAPPDSPRIKNARILVVDDNDAVRAAVREILTSWGAQVIEADGAEFALGELHRAWVEGQPYKLVLVDGAMSPMDGFEMIKALRAQPRETEPAILMLTTDDLAQKVARSRELGIQAYLLKPVMRAHLAREIGVALGTAKPAAEAPVRPAPKIEQPPPAERSLRILLADDSPHNRLLVKQYLKSLPFALDTAENGAAAIEMFAKARYDLVLMDLRMPVMDGLTAVRRMRQLEQSESRETPTPIVALSASALEEDIRESIDAGCTSHLSKPIKKSLLLAAIRDLTQKPKLDGAQGNGAHSNGSPDAAKIESASARVPAAGQS